MDLPRYHRLRQQLYRLQGTRCASCSAVAFPPRPTCASCGSPDAEPVRLSGRGEVFSFSHLAQPPHGFGEQGPYCVAMVRLDEGLLVTAQLTDVNSDEVAIGMRVEMVTRRLREHGDRGFIVYGYKFRPLLDGPTQKVIG